MYFFIFLSFFGTGREIRTPINGFGDRHATIAPYPCGKE
jgi:hypothetical protein